MRENINDKCEIETQHSKQIHSKIGHKQILTRQSIWSNEYNKHFKLFLVNFRESGTTILLFRTWWEGDCQTFWLQVDKLLPTSDQFNKSLALISIFRSVSRVKSTYSSIWASRLVAARRCLTLCTSQLWSDSVSPVPTPAGKCNGINFSM